MSSAVTSARRSPAALPASRMVVMASRSSGAGLTAADFGDRNSRRHPGPHRWVVRLQLLGLLPDSASTIATPQPPAGSATGPNPTANPRSRWRVRDRHWCTSLHGGSNSSTGPSPTSSRLAGRRCGARGWCVAPPLAAPAKLAPGLTAGELGGSSGRARAASCLTTDATRARGRPSVKELVLWGFVNRSLTVFLLAPITRTAAGTATYACYSCPERQPHGALGSTIRPPAGPWP